MAELDADHPRLYIQAVQLQRRRGLLEDTPALLDSLGSPNGPGREYSEGLLMFYRGKPQESPDHFARALEGYRQMGHLAGQAAGHNALGSVADSTKQYDVAVEHFEAALELLESVEDLHGQTDVLDNMARIERRRGQPEVALEHYRQNLAIREKLGDRVGQAQSWISIGRTLSKIGNRAGVIQAYERSLEIHREINHRPGQISSLSLLAGVYADSEDWNRAVEYRRQARRIAAELPNTETEARTLRKLGEALMEAGRVREAIEPLGDAAVIFGSLDSKAREANALNSLGTALNRVGEFRQAREVLERAVQLAEEGRNSSVGAKATTNLSRTCIAMGDLTAALIHEEQALRLYRKKKNRAGELRSLTNLGVIYYLLGDADRARRYVDETLSAAEELGDTRSLMLARNNLAVLLAEDEALDSALEQLQQSIVAAQSLDDQRATALAHANTAAVLQGLGRQAEAFEYVDLALSGYREVGDPAGEAFALNMLGELQLVAGMSKESAGSHSVALEIAEGAGLADERWRAHAGRAAALDRMGKSSAALTEAVLAIDEVESLRARIELPDLKMRFLAGKIDLYEHALALLLPRDAVSSKPEVVARSFQFAERARARSLLDLLAESRSELRSGLEPELRLREAQLLEGLSAAAVELAGNPDPESRAAARQRLTDVEEQLERLQIEIHRSAPKYAEIAYPRPASLNEVQSRALRAGETLMEFFIGDERAWVWLVDRDGATLHPLAAPGEIEARVAEFLERVDPGARSPAGNRSELASAARLAAAVIPTGALPAAGRLLVVPDGALHHVPFEALRVDDRFLIESHEIAVVPSATALLLMREQPSPVAAKGFLGLGDPLLPADESRFPRLPFSLREVNGIAELFAEDERRVLTGEQATKAGVRALDLAEFRFVHFATHGWLDAESPRLSGLRLSVTEPDAAQDLLSLNEILALRLASEVVVVSACQSGLGELLEGEGLVSLTRAFLYAGARTVIVSLWNVGDRSTADFMHDLYRRLHDGKSAAAALREAKLEFLSSERPYRRSILRWAPFVLVGNSGGHHENLNRTARSATK
jgi:CHAT domain-containing protein/Tfp pilus assembly protein PilF